MATTQSDCAVDRTLEEAETILQYAKLGPGDVMSTVQCLGFTQQLENDSLRLLEVDQTVLDSLSNGDEVCIRGHKGDSAVLCIADKTYDLREAETSNNLLLLPECSLASDIETEENKTLILRLVIAMKQDYYELRKMRPKLKRMTELLLENIFAGKELEEDDSHKGKKYTFSELSDRVQASDQELLLALQKLNACLIDGYWRMLDADFMDTVLTNVLAAADENSMDFTTIFPHKICSSMQDLYPRYIVEHIIRCFTEQKLEPQQIAKPPSFAEDETVRLSEDKICRFVAENFLKLNEKYNLNEFEKVWQAAVPAGMKTGMYQLEGMVLIDKDLLTPVIRYFPVTELPETVEERFNTLFRTKNKWSMDEIKPFIEDLATEKMSVGVLLTKNARASTQGGIKVYSSRRMLT